ncbi:Cys-tRNA(Pro) deacylase [Serinibacter arcticus]|uniref:Cys-tRNA(Pro)/Cys-tRNA(Cys) deacylase n=1 Tax=Serinibacter arcticus TaxID=1655435 RepID=A0A2U1ZVB7_9MICO|nr:Cys-tRNA(Pro) deacylase [Serinibacter arcticus]PWD50935.1 Cys-tRNA(Pro) deacylase [Serinibacter arcticus]
MSTTAPGTPATVTLQQADVDFVAHLYDHDPRAASFGLEASEKLGIEPERVYKTLMVDVDGELVVAVAPVSGQVDLKEVARAVGGKRAAMADPTLAQRRTGYVVGGISPLGQKLAHRLVLDSTAILQETILVSGGRRGFDIELAPDDLLRVTGGEYGDIGKP